MARPGAGATPIAGIEPKSNARGDDLGPPAAVHGEMPPPVAAHVLVGGSGSLEEVGDGRGLRLAQAMPELVAYAMALIASDRDSVRFIVVGPERDWTSVRIDVKRGRLDGPRALLSLETVTPPFGLTPRELDVLTLLSAGLTNPEIAMRLETSPRTITKHVENILSKTGNWTRAGAAGLAIDRGYLRLPTPGGAALLPLTVGIVERLAKEADSPRPSVLRPLQRRPIIIGAPLSLSGFAREDAAEMLNGANLAIQEINGRGGVLGRELQMMVVDCDVSDVNSVLRGHQALIEAEVDAIAAGYSTAQLDVQALLGNYRAPYLHATTMERAVDQVRQDPSRLGHVFQVCPSDIHYGPSLARFLIELEERREWKPFARRLTVLQPDWPGMDVGVPALERLLAPLGWRIDFVAGLPLKNIDWPTVMARLREFDPSVVFLAYYFTEESVAFQKAFRANPIPALVYTLYSPSIPVYVEELGEKAEGVIWATTTGLYSDRIGNGFVARYRQRYGVMPGRSHAGIAYDRIRMLADAWARVGNPRSFGKMAEDLRTTVHRGVNGAYLLGSEGQAGLGFPHDTRDPSISQAHLIFQIQNGTHRILSPNPYADGQFRMPPWARPPTAA